MKKVELSVIGGGGGAVDSYQILKAFFDIVTKQICYYYFLKLKAKLVSTMHRPRREFTLV